MERIDRWDFLRFFKRAEFNSPDALGSGEMMNTRLIFGLDALRAVLGRPLVINSGYRTKRHNTAIKGAPASAHLTGEAVDISTAGWPKEDRAKLIAYALKLGFTGIGVGATFIHLDIKGRRSWRYAGGKTIAVEVGKELDLV